MGTTTFSEASLIAANSAYWGSGTLGYLILLKPDLYSGNWTVNASTDVVTTAAAHGLITGSKVTLSTTGVFPALSSGSVGSTTDYYVIYASSTTLKLALSLADAVAGTAINFIDTGSGTHTITEQRPTITDPISVLINKELSHSSYARKIVTGATPTIVGTDANQPPTVFTISPMGSNLVYRQVLFLRGATSTIGNTTGSEPVLYTETSDVTVTVGASKVLLLTLGVGQ